MKMTMKKYIFIAVAGILALSACSKIDDTQNAPRQMTFTAGYNEGAQTRASLDGSTKKVSFDANDKISILSTKNTNTQFTTSAGGASATFSGTATDDSKFYAVYPYTAGLTLSGDVISGIVIPTSQWNSNWGNGFSAYSGWDPKAPIAYATTTGSSLTFHNACAILKVTITGSGTWAIFTISANEPLAGTFSLDTSTGTLTPTSGSTTVAVGTDFSYTNCFDTSGNKTAYIAIAPGTYTNFTLYLTNEDGGHNSKTKSGSVTFEAGKIYDLGSYNVEYFD